MFKFENPLDPSKDGINALMDGIRFNIRNSEMIKEEIINNPRKVKSIIEQLQGLDDYLTPIKILDHILEKFGYSLEELIISDEHELLDWMMNVILEE